MLGEGSQSQEDKDCQAPGSLNPQRQRVDGGPRGRMSQGTDLRFSVTPFLSSRGPWHTLQDTRGEGRRAPRGRIL